jgi:RNA polymerase sigma-70 factor (ECF subfamily)
MQRSPATLPPAAATAGAWILAGAVALPDPDALERVMREHNQRLFRLALGLVGDASEAEDVLQDSYVRAFRVVTGLAGGSFSAAWLARIVRNTAIDHLRARRSRQAAFSLESELPLREGERGSALEAVAGPAARDDPESSLGRAQVRARLEAAVLSLPRAFRAVFLLREVQGLSLQETALYLGVPVATVKTRDHRARGLLRKRLQAAREPALADAFLFLGERCDRIVARVLARIGC